MNLNSMPLKEIHKCVRPVAYSQKDLEALKIYLTGAIKNALDIEVDGGFQNASEMMREGLLRLQSRDLKSEFAFINIDAGRGFFGGQKTSIATYTADLYRNEYFPGPVMPGLLRALIGINNMYRAVGLLHGTGI